MDLVVVLALVGLVHLVRCTVRTVRADGLGERPAVRAGRGAPAPVEGADWALGTVLEPVR